MLPKSDDVFGQVEYWDNFFDQSDTFEWYGEFADFRAVFYDLLGCSANRRDTVSILNVGCGNSDLPLDLFDDGFLNVTSIDFSQKAIDRLRYRSAFRERKQFDHGPPDDGVNNRQGKEKSKGTDENNGTRRSDSVATTDDKSLNCNCRPSLVFECLDVAELQTKYEADSFDCIIDKGLLDGMVSGKCEPDSIRAYLDNVSSILNGSAGCLLIISLAQNTVLRQLTRFLLSDVGSALKLEIHSYRYKVKNKCAGKAASLLPYVFVLRHAKTSRFAMDRCTLIGGEGWLEDTFPVGQLQGKMAEVWRVRALSAMACKYQPGQRNDFQIELPKDGTKYSLVVYDNGKKAQSKNTAAFLVPMGQECEWTYSAPEGNQILCEMCKAKRLIIILMERGSRHWHHPVSAIQDELASFLTRLKLPESPSKIDIVTTGEPDHRVKVVGEYASAFADRILVRDIVPRDSSEPTTRHKRQLVFGVNSRCVQSEIWWTGAEPNEEFDFYQLENGYQQAAMTVMETQVTQSNDASVVLLGLGKLNTSKCGESTAFYAESKKDRTEIAYRPVDCTGLSNTNKIGYFIEVDVYDCASGTTLHTRIDDDGLRVC